MYYEEKVQETFERLSVLHSSEEDKMDFFLTKAWESYWLRMEFTNWFKRKKGVKKSKEII